MASMFSKAKLPWSSSDAGQTKQADEEGESLTTVLRTDEDRSYLTILREDSAKNTEDDEAIDKANKELEARQKEVSGAKVQELKKAALAYFDEWRDNVILRVGEVVNSKEAAEEQKEHAQPVVKSQSTPKVMEHDLAAQQALEKLYPPVKTILGEKLDEEKRKLVLHSMLLLLLSLEHYKAHSRTLMVYLTTSLGLSMSILSGDESKIARGLLSATENMKADDETKKQAEENSDSRKWKVGLATVAGAALIGVTGGLAAPLIAAGVGTMMGGLGLGATAGAAYLGTLAGSSVLVGGLFGAYGGRMTGKMMDQYAREVQDFAFVPIRTYHKPRKIEKEYRRLRVAVGISGWLTDKDEVVEPWKVIGPEMESFALRFELEALMNLGNSLTSMITSAAWGYAKKEIISRTLFAGLMAGMAWPLGLLKVGRIIDNPWSVASHRATRAGEVLADALINKAQGERPVTLIGYSLGARVIYTCLQRLAERKAFGLIESVVLVGSPTPSATAEWRNIRSVVAGRVINVYSTNDYILAFLYRSNSFQSGVAGLEAIEYVKGVENLDVSSLVTGHTSYRFLTGRILQKIGFEDIDQAQLGAEEAKRKEVEAKEEKERLASENKEGAKATGDSQNVSDQHVKDLENEIDQKNQQSYVGWMGEKMTAAGTSAGSAYEKAKAQWSSRKSVDDAEPPAKDGNAASPSSKDLNFEQLRARSEARRAAQEEEIMKG